MKKIKLLYPILILGFLIWMLFFDTNSYLAHRNFNKEKNKLIHENKKIEGELEQEKKEYNKLKYDPNAREKYARENYFFKKENEDIFIIITDSTKKK